MNNVEIFVTVAFVLGFIIVIITFIKDPKGALLGVVAIPYAIVLRMWDLIKLVTIPIWGPIWLLDQHYGWRIFEFKTSQGERSDITYTGRERTISFDGYRKFIFSKLVEPSEIEGELVEAAQTMPDFKTNEFEITRRQDFSVLELPNIGLYGFGFMVQWISEKFADRQVVGFATNNELDFFIYQDLTTVNNLIGKTSEGDSFSLSMYDDLDNKQALNLNNEIQVDTEFTLDYFRNLLDVHST